VQGRDGPVECKVAGVGAGGLVPMSIISLAAKESFLPPDQPPDSLNVHPLPGADIQALEADLYALSDRYGDKVWIFKPEEEISAVMDTSDQLQSMLNGLLLLAEIAAALGMVNTTLMSIAERRRELGLLRAVGATRRQVTVVILSQAGLMGIIGAGLGIVAGVGMGAIFALAYGGISFGLVDLPLWEAAGETVLPALQTGYLGFMVAPLLAVAAAYPAIRAILRGSVYLGTSPGDFAEIRKSCRLPDGVFPIIMLSLGYPRARPRPKRKLGVDVLVHSKQYHEMADQEVLDAFGDKYPGYKAEVTKERLARISQVCREVHGEEFAKRCVDRITEAGYINRAQYIFGLYYRASILPTWNEVYLEYLIEFGFKVGLHLTMVGAFIGFMTTE